MNNYSTEQLQKIVDDAPEGADYIKTGSIQEDIYLRFQTGRLEFFGKLSKCWRDTGYQSLESAYGKGVRKLIKLSDIRAELLARQFKVGDRVVIVNKPNASMELHLVLEPTNSTSVGVAPINRLSGQPILMCQQLASPRYLRHATAEEEAAGHRIDEPASSCGMTAAEIDQFGEDLRNKPYVDLPEFEQPDTITAKLDPAKCRVVDPTVYDAPPDSPRDDFDAMSEKHRSPSCKCHELPIDAELKAPAGMKHDQSKPRYSLIPAGALALVVDVLEYGATKYAPDGWKHVKNARERYYNASMRHIQSWWSGEQNDPETNLPHLAHAACSLMFLMWLDGEQGE